MCLRGGTRRSLANKSLPHDWLCFAAATSGKSSLQSEGSRSRCHFWGGIFSALIDVERNQLACDLATIDKPLACGCRLLLLSLTMEACETTVAGGRRKLTRESPTDCRD